MNFKPSKLQLSSLLVSLSLLFLSSCSEDDSCGRTLISFNNKTSSTIYIRVPGHTNGYEAVAAGSSTTLFDLTPGQEITYTIASGPSGSGDFLRTGSEVAKDCISLGIDIN